MAVEREAQRDCHLEESCWASPPDPAYLRHPGDGERVAGALLGALLGGLLPAKLTQIRERHRRGQIGHRFLNPDIYFIDFLPTELHMQDLLIAPAPPS